MHHQRHRRARRQRRAGRSRDGDAGAQRRDAVSGPASTPSMLTRASKLVVGGHLVPGAVQQGDRRAERLRPRKRHPPGRHAQAHPDLRDHDARGRRREADLAGHGQAFRPPCLRAQARRNWAIDLAGNQLEDAFVRFKALADRKKHRLRRGHRGAGRRGDRDRPGSHQAVSLCGHRRHPRPAARHHEARHRRREGHASGAPATARSTRSSTASRRWCRTRRCWSSIRSTR